MEATVVVGASNPHADELEAAAGQSHIPIRLVHNVGDMAELIAWADVAVATSGCTVWELLFLGTPNLLLVSADNQRYVAEQVESEEAGKTLGWAKDISVEPLAKAVALLLKDFDWRVKAVENALQIVDGQGAERAARTILDYSREAMDDRQ